MVNATFSAIDDVVSISTASVSKPELNLVTKSMISEIVQAQKDKTEYASLAAKAEKELDKKLVELFYTLFGTKTKDEIKQIDPTTIQKMFEDHYGKTFDMEKGLDFKLQLSNKGQYPSWRGEFVALTNEAVAAEIAAKTPYSYSYKVIQG